MKSSRGFCAFVAVEWRNIFSLEIHYGKISDGAKSGELKM
jgi:hypothetical protein